MDCLIRTSRGPVAPHCPEEQNKNGDREQNQTDSMP